MSSTERQHINLSATNDGIDIQEHIFTRGNRRVVYLGSPYNDSAGFDVSQDTDQTPRSKIDLAIEASWLLALALVPLAFSGRDVVVLFLQPKDFLLHLFALLILALWSIEWALGGFRPQIDLGSWSAIRAWIGADPRHWALVSAAAFGLAVVVSTLLSPLPAVSMWGRNFAELGYELYSVLSLLVLFFAVALRVRSADQVRRIIWVIAGAGAVTGVYGISQRYGWDPIGNGGGESRVVSSFGNPIFFGSYLVMSAVVTAGLALDPERKQNRSWLPVIAVALGVQLAAMWFTGSRGPWIGLLVGILALATMIVVRVDRSELARVGAVAAGALLLAFIVTNLAGEPDEGPARGLGSVVSGVTPSAGGLGARGDIWEGSLRLLDSWEVQQQDNGARTALRPVFGFGPEMYLYSYPLVANPQPGVVLVGHAHNFPLHLFFEYGAAGLLSFATLSGSVLIAGIAIVRRGAPGSTPGGELMFAATTAVLAALIGRSIEQGAGVARVGDLVGFWVLMSLVLAMYRSVNDGQSTLPRQMGGSLKLFPLGIAATISVVALLVFMTRDVQMLRAGFISADAFDRAAEGETSEAAELLRRASDVAPDVEQYHVWAGELLVELARIQNDPAEAFPLLGEAYETFIVYQDRDPFAFTTQLRLGLAEAELVNRGDRFRLQDMVDRSSWLADALPSYPSIQAVAAERVLIGGQLELGLELADRAIAMETGENPQPFAWFMRGNALGDLGDLQGAIQSFSTALARGPDERIAIGIHSNMALVYDAMGDAAEADRHRSLAESAQSRLNSAQ